LLDVVTKAFSASQQPIVFAYALGKAQEATRLLTDAGLNVTAHGAVANVNDAYRELGIELGPYRRYQREDFHGTRALDLRERGVLIAPPANARTSFALSFHQRRTVMLSGWGIDPSAKYRYGVDEVIPISDHADFDELLETVERVSPKIVHLQHGFVREFGDTLRQKGIDARPAQPESQLELF
jgi:DNA ligase-1